MASSPPHPPARPGRCPRCGGRLALHRDPYGDYLGCLMCGFTRELLSPAAIALDQPPDPPAPEPDR